MGIRAPQLGIRPEVKGLVHPFLAATLRFVRFSVVGGSGVFVDMGMFFLLSDPRSLNWDLSISKALAAEVAILNNFIWNDVWTFRDLTGQRTQIRARAGRFWRFNLICFAGIGLSLLLLNIQVHMFGVNQYIANFVATFLVSLWNFFMNLKFGWNRYVKTEPLQPGRTA